MECRPFGNTVVRYVRLQGTIGKGCVVLLFLKSTINGNNRKYGLEVCCVTLSFGLRDDGE